MSAGYLGCINTQFLWTTEQNQSMLLQERKVLLEAGYGHGKTLILKSKAIQVVKKEEEEEKEEGDRAKVFFVSFGAADNEVRKLCLFNLAMKL